MYESVFPLYGDTSDVIGLVHVTENNEGRRHSGDGYYAHKMRSTTYLYSMCGWTIGDSMIGIYIG